MYNVENENLTNSLVNTDGFGPEGREAADSEGAVPANAVLIIDLEVLSWNTVETVTDDNLVVKKITRQGESYEKPNYGATVTGKHVFGCFGSINIG